ncbi:hypothetical protein [Hymenobacter koreensis]|uniref:Uncharacterized protein n=1 Tax=Hymenobacter koreensis TaxID=1084523 RepID=A0ABP8JJQ0_9BACT
MSDETNDVLENLKRQAEAIEEQTAAYQAIQDRKHLLDSIDRLHTAVSLAVNVPSNSFKHDQFDALRDKYHALLMSL